MKNKKWVKTRHNVATKIALFILRPLIKYKYKFTCERIKGEKRPYFIITNHQTPFDQFFVYEIFNRALYVVTTEDVFSSGLLSNLIRFFFAPIPFKKGTSDIGAIMSCMRVKNEGGSIAIFPEGNRTYSGKTGYMKPSISKLIKALKMPLAIVKIENGYGVEPRWSSVVRKGKGRAYVSKIIEVEELDKMTNEELFDIIKEELFVNEALPSGNFVHKKRAEYLERAVYVCPYCGFSKFKSKNEKVKCLTCGRQIIYNYDKSLTGDGFDFVFSNFGEWYDYQCDFVRNADLTKYEREPIFIDEVNLFKVIVGKAKKRLLKRVTLKLFGDRIEFCSNEKVLSSYGYDEIYATAVLGRNKFNFYVGNDIFQVKGDKRFNGLKYMNIYYAYKNDKENNDGQFLGI